MCELIFLVLKVAILVWACGIDAFPWHCFVSLNYEYWDKMNCRRLRRRKDKDFI